MSKFKAGDRVVRRRDRMKDRTATVVGDYMYDIVIVRYDGDNEISFVRARYLEPVTDKIDWNAPLEAYHPDGRVMAVESCSRPDKDGDRTIRPFLKGGWNTFSADGRHYADATEWRIRNRVSGIDMDGCVTREQAERQAKHDLPGAPEWGAPIAVDGEQPDWLRDDESVEKTPNHNLSNPQVLLVKLIYWPNTLSIRLPANHPYYTATERGFTYWPGGESAPDDWDQSSGVIYRAGHVSGIGTHGNWTHMGAANDIIGYRRRMDASSVSPDLVDRMVRLVRDIASATPPAPSAVSNDPNNWWCVARSIVSDLPAEPVDPLIERAREICAAESLAFRDDYAGADADDSPIMRAVLRALRDE